MIHPASEALADRARSYARQLDERTGPLADRPTEGAWHDLRKLTTAVDRWANDLRTTMAQHERDDQLTAAYLDLATALEEAVQTVADLRPLYADRAGSRSRRGPDERPAGPGTFIARYGGHCHACDQRVEVGDVARFGIGKKLQHDVCPGGADA